MQYYDYSHELFESSLLAALADGSLPPATLDGAVGRVLRVKFLLGLFENPFTDPDLQPRVLRCPEHTRVALEGARAGLCLLKNEGGLLPLPKTLGTIAVLGPSAAVARLGDYTPWIEGFTPVTLLDGVRAWSGPTTLSSTAGAAPPPRASSTPVPASCLRDFDGRPGLRGEYFASEAGGVPVMVRNDALIDFNWVIAKPDETVPSQGFSRALARGAPDARKAPGLVGVSSQDSVRLWLDDALVVDAWGFPPGQRGRRSPRPRTRARLPRDGGVPQRFERSRGRLRLERRTGRVERGPCGGRRRPTWPSSLWATRPRPREKA